MTERVIVYNDVEQLWAACDGFVRESINWVAGTGHRPGVFFSGGATYVPFYGRFADFAGDVFPTDERLVMPGTGGDIGAMLEREWRVRLVNPESRLITVSRQSDAVTTAALYEQSLRSWQAQGGAWAVALLSLGVDGHTASLFPSLASSWEGSDAWVVPVEGAPEPFTSRISVSPTLLRQVPRHIVVAIGSDKKDIIKSWLVKRERLPVEYVQPFYERFVLLDRNAALELRPDRYEIL